MIRPLDVTAKTGDALGNRPCKFLLLFGLLAGCLSISFPCHGQEFVGFGSEPFAGIEFARSVGFDIRRLDIRRLRERVNGMHRARRGCGTRGPA